MGVIQYDERWRAYVLTKKDADIFRVIDETPQYHRIKQGLPPYIKYTNLYIYDRQDKRYYLPPSKHKTNKLEYLKNTPPQLREYQKYAISNTFWPQSWKAGVIKAWTGTGKSYIAYWFAVMMRSIIVVPNISIGKGIIEKLTELIPNNKPSFKYLVSSQIQKTPKELPDILVITRASLFKVWDIVNGNYQQLIIDECHFLWDTMQYMANTFKWASIVWLTATMQRKELDSEGFRKYFWQVTELEAQPLPCIVLKLINKYDMPLAEYVKLTKDQKDPTSPEALRLLINNCETRTKLVNKLIQKLKDNYDIFGKHIIFCDRHDKLNQIIEDNYKDDKDLIVITWKHKDELGLEDWEFKGKWIVWTSQSIGTGFDAPELQTGVLTFSTTRENTVIQTAWRMRRPHKDKQYWIYIDIQDKFRIGNRYRYFWARERDAIYAKEWYLNISTNIDTFLNASSEEIKKLLTSARK